MRRQTLDWEGNRLSCNGDLLGNRLPYNGKSLIYKYMHRPTSIFNPRSIV